MSDTSEDTTDTAYDYERGDFILLSRNPKTTFKLYGFSTEVRDYPTLETFKRITRWQRFVRWLQWS